jgi:hypothetical protein
VRAPELPTPGSTERVLTPDNVARLPIDANDLTALVALAETLLALERPRDAERAVRRVLRFDEEHAGALFVEGLLLARQHRMRDAVASWHHAIAADVDGRVAERARRAALDAGTGTMLGLVA